MLCDGVKGGESLVSPECKSLVSHVWWSFVCVYHLSVLGQQSGQSPDLDPGPASLESFLWSRVVWHVAARSLY